MTEDETPDELSSRIALVVARVAKELVAFRVRRVLE